MLQLPLLLPRPQRPRQRLHRLQHLCEASQENRSLHPRVQVDAFLRPRVAVAIQAAAHRVERAAVLQEGLDLEAQEPRVDIEVDQALQPVPLVVDPEAPALVAVLQAAAQVDQVDPVDQVDQVVLQVAEVDAQVVVPVVDPGRGLVARSVVVAV